MMTRFEKIKNHNYKFNDEIENKLWFDKRVEIPVNKRIILKF
jgi:hypothetical protein